MRTLRRRQLIGAALAALATSRAAPDVRAAAQSGVLRRVVASEVTSMDPQRPTGQVTADLAAELFTGLTFYDRDGRLAPGCAASWQSAADGLTWTFRLRPGLKWSDGRALTSRDFLFTLRRYLAPETGAQQASRLDAIGGARDLRLGNGRPESLAVEAPDPLVLRIRLDHPDVELPLVLGAAYCVPEHVIAVRGREWSKPEYLVSNGAYALQSWAAGAKIIRLRRNSHYHDAANVRIERVDWLTGYDDPTRLRLFKLGEVDVATLEDAGNLGIARRELAGSLHASPECAIGLIGVNTARGRLGDARVRRALALAIDRRVLTDKVRGLGERPSDALLPPGLPGYPNPARPSYADWPMPRRIAAARELLDQAGVAFGAPPAIGIGFPSSATGRKVYLAIAAMWKSVGVAAQLQPLEGRAYTAALLKGQFDVFSYNTFAAVPTASVFLDRFQSDSPINFCAYRSADFDRAFHAAERQPTAAQRADAYAQAERLVLRDLPVIPLYSGASNRLVASRVVGWVDHPGHAHPSQYLALR
jgi:ABC-type oligopeptide transport system substrate-binding subunit